jgi:predicted component of type VI protein secretion system
MAKLIFSGDKFHGRTYELTLAKTTVGRGDQNTLILRDPSVSHSHCEILVFGDEVIVRDLGSKNGTLTKGVRLHNQQRPLHHGDHVQFGDVEARLELDAPSDTDTDFTAIHEYAEILRGQEGGKAHAPADALLKLGDSRDGDSADHTTVLPPSPPRPATAPDSAAQTPIPEKPATRFPWALFVAMLLSGLVLALWLLFRNY